VSSVHLCSVVFTFTYFCSGRQFTDSKNVKMHRNGDVDNVFRQLCPSGKILIVCAVPEWLPAWPELNHQFRG